MATGRLTVTGAPAGPPQGGENPAPAPGTSTPQPQPQPRAATTLTVTAARVGRLTRAALLRRGLRVTHTYPAAGTAKVVLSLGGKRLAATTVRVATAGPRAVRLTLGKAGRRALGSRRSGTLTVTATFIAAGGGTASARSRVTMR